MFSHMQKGYFAYVSEVRIRS